jgi:hypothetical protein
MVFVVVLSGACATVGHEFDTAHVDDIQKGVQDKQQIIGWFGQPYQTTKPLVGNPLGCIERWQWTHAHAVSGGSTTSESLVVDFDAAGKVCDNAFSKIQ